MKKFTLITIAIMALCTFCTQKSSEEAHYRAALEKMIVDAQIPLIQVEYNSPAGQLLLQVENPNFYDSVKIAEGVATPHPAIFQAASLSKVVFSYIVMQMYEKGEIDLDTPLCEYTDIERFKLGGDEKQVEQARKITARMVLNHRSGLPDWSTGPSSPEWPTSPIAFEFAPDSCYGYSGEAFAFLQRAVEAIKGKDIEAIAREQLFDPLQMDNTSYTWLPQYDTLAVDGYNFRNENRGKGRHPRANVAYTLRTSAADYSKFLQALLNGTGLKPETAALMFDATTGPAFYFASNHRDCDSTIAWGMGIGTENNAHYGKVLWHWGDNGNFKALFIIIPNTKSTLVYFTNSNHGHEIVDKLTALILKDETPFAISQWIPEE